MRGRSARSIGVAALALVTFAAGAFAQTGPEAAGQETPAPAASQAAPAASASASAPSVAYPAGATWSDGKTTTPKGAAAPVRHHVRRIRHASSAEATLPGFEMLADGGSRVFVQLTKSVDVAEQRGQTRVVTKKKGKSHATTASTITYVLHGTDVLKRNNENALVTVHFNTPVASARLMGAGTDARLVVHLRADATPTWKIEPAKNGTAILEIDFPKGDYLPAEPSAPASAGGDPSPPPEPADSKQN